MITLLIPREIFPGRDFAGDRARAPIRPRRVAAGNGMTFDWNSADPNPGAPHNQLAGAGRTTRERLLFFASLSISMRPAFASIAQRAMASPSPTPPESPDRPGSTR